MSIISHVTEKLRTSVSRTIVGQEKSVERLLVALYAGGHVLLEDMPGTGKTELAKSLAVSIGSTFARIQCTPDLLPSDITGSTIYNQHKQQFQFQKGPLFHQVILVDEINRAIPRSQSALLEAMAEGQITVDGHTYPLRPPFFVIATQNPIESQGTFPLPEAQLDRFFMKFSLGYPSLEEERSIFHLSHEREKLKTAPVVTSEEILQVQAAIKEVTFSSDVELYMLHLVRHTRKMEGVSLGVSPRGLIALGRAAQAQAAIRGRNYVLPDDLKEVAKPVLAHRLVLDPAVRMQKVTPQEIIERVINEVTAPVENEQGAPAS
ncbi:MoxR family ATPase [Mechercharimyces sp. CAU 1602]|uniref:AAA family ATPase n=1 Tax=Mechercharimyces sp. CAU 1602 TaxID=2973933 RepID=UPI0021625482|nr:MoxR family ATPase [Mechercharimyces sp. CAU 1602]MCS1351046.1 MoxR family ATPase [Mechercharimyces sp. CAU 1602]